MLKKGRQRYSRVARSFDVPTRVRPCLLAHCGHPANLHEWHPV